VPNVARPTTASSIASAGEPTLSDEVIPTARQLLRTRGVGPLLSASTMASMAAIIQVTALGILLYDLSHRDLDLGLLGLAEFLPAMLLMTVTGSVADRFDRRRIISIGLIGEMICCSGLAWYAGSGHRLTWPIFGLVVAFGTARAFVNPAIRSMPADLAPDGGLPRLTAFNIAGWQTSVIIGPVLAGFLYVGSPSWPFIACMILTTGGAFAIRFAPKVAHLHATDDTSINGAESAAMVALADENRPAELLDATAERYAHSLDAQDAPVDGSEEAATVATSRWHEASEGFRVIRSNPILLGAISLDLFAVLFGGAVALLPAIASKQLHVNAVGLGWLRAAGGIGAASVTFWLSARPLRRRIGPTLFVVVALFGIFTIVLGVTHSFVVAFLAMLLLSAVDSVSVFIRGTLVPLVTPSAARGRVMAVEGVFLGASNELGAFESGVAGQLLGTGPAVVLGGIATLGVVGIWSVLFPALSRVDRFPERPPE
jgi:Major Facilitator Superfamily